ncbi:MAG: hypothetical protein ACREAM_07005, partial [Blastocatellia bacterium]
VFVPDQQTVPRDAQIYRVLDPSPGRAAPITPPRAAPLTSFWRGAPDKGRELICWIDALRHAWEQPGKVAEAIRSLPRLLATGRLFREAVESLSVPHMYSSLVRDASWLVEYGRAGGPLQTDSVIAAVWEDVEERLPQALDAAERLQQWFLYRSLLEHLARRVAGGADGLAPVRKLAEAGRLADFCKTVSAPDSLTDRQEELVAERLLNERYYSGQIHRAIAGKLLRQMADGGREGAYRRGQWLREQAGLLNDPFVAAVADLWQWGETPVRQRWDLRLGKYRLADVEQYRNILPVAWRLSLPFVWWDRVLAAYHPDYREAFFAFCARRLKGEDLPEQKDFLRALALICKPHGRENDSLIEAIGDADRPYELARRYAELQRQLDDPDVETIRHLQSFKPPSSLLGKLWRK